MKPAITVPLVDQINKELSNVLFTCVAIANPPAVINWKLNGNPLNNRSDSNGIKISITQNTIGDCMITNPPSHCETCGTLKIFNIQQSDGGRYICEAENDAGNITKSALLIVIGKY